jgi:hypothetical protein
MGYDYPLFREWKKQDTLNTIQDIFLMIFDMGLNKRRWIRGIKVFPAAKKTAIILDFHIFDIILRCFYKDFQ